MTTPAEGLAELRAAAADGRLDALCDRHAIRLLTVFGSAVHRPDAACDLDVAIAGHPGRRVDVLALITDLAELTGVEAIDLAVLDDAPPLLQERALVRCVPLFEAEEGGYADAQSAAIGQRIETDHLRRLDLELLAR